MRKFVGILAALAVIGCAEQTPQGPFEQGQAAFKAKDYATAYRLLQPLAEQGNPVAQNDLGLMYLTGGGRPKDTGEAIKWFQKAAAQGHAVAENNLGTIYFDGIGVPRNYEQGLVWLHRADEHGNAAATNLIGTAYYSGHGVKQDYVEAASWLRRAAEAGDANAQSNYGRMLLNGTGITRDYDQARTWLTKAGDSGNATAQATLGDIYNAGIGIPSNYAEAMRWYRKAADQSNAVGENGVGYLYYTGKTVTQDYAQALSWFRKAAAHGNATAQANLGDMYSKGNGVGLDYGEAASWFRKSADQGNVVAQYSLGYLYEVGLGVTRDYVQAMALYRKAALQGNGTGQLKLAGLYASGLGAGIPDNVRAYAWYNIAAARLAGVGQKSATDGREKVAAKLSAADITKAQKLASDCQQSGYADCGEPKEAVASVPIPTGPTTSVTTPVAIVVPAPISVGHKVIPMESGGGVYTVPVQINGAFTLKFVVDSGAAEVVLPADVVMTLVRTGTIQASDFISDKVFVTADGTKVPSKSFRIHSLKIGDTTINDVNGLITDVKGTPLLGQSFLNRFKSWSIDNGQHALVLE